jgi:hypothetical protein
MEKWRSNNNFVLQYDGNGNILIATCNTAKNAQLIAAAPALLDACKAAHDWLSQCPPGTQQREIADELEQAIKLAEKGE